MPELVRTQVYATPSDVWNLQMPDTVKATDFTPGFIGPVTFTGTGSGSLILSEAPCDAYDFRIKVTLGGELGTARARTSHNAGVDFSPEFVLLDDSPILLATARGYRAGMFATFSNGLAPPSFVLNNIWSFITTASPQILDKIISICDYVDSIIGNPDSGGRYHLPLISWPRILADVVAKIVRYELLSMRGFDFKGRDKQYMQERDWAVNWLQDVALYKVHPAIKDSLPVTYAPNVVLGPDRYKIVRKDPNV